MVESDSGHSCCETTVVSTMAPCCPSSVDFGVILHSFKKNYTEYFLGLKTTNPQNIHLNEQQVRKKIELKHTVSGLKMAKTNKQKAKTAKIQQLFTIFVAGYG